MPLCLALNPDEMIRNFITMWVTIDPFGTIPLFLIVTRGMTPAQARRVALKSVCVSAGLLLGFLVLGQILLAKMGIHLTSFQIAGGIVLFLFALTMVFGVGMFANQNTPETGHDVAVFPLAVPSIAGPGALLAIVVITDNDRYSIPEQAVSAFLMLLVLLILLGMLMMAGRIQKTLGDTGLNILTRVMGLILASVAVETVIKALRSLPSSTP
ncbi:MAG: MarC family protein [Verrucomicrobiae bacterium]|nr:MarC family protein [Verrucomicrobiae bacterium]